MNVFNILARSKAQTHPRAILGPRENVSWAPLWLDLVGPVYTQGIATASSTYVQLQQLLCAYLR